MLNESVVNESVSGILGGQIGLQIIESDTALVMTQTKFPKSKKKRIRKKWSRQDRYKTLVPGIIRIGNKLIVHSEIMPAIERLPSRK